MVFPFAAARVLRVSDLTFGIFSRFFLTLQAKTAAGNDSYRFRLAVPESSSAHTGFIRQHHAIHGQPRAI
jgi:hypothetical protein